jgi:hypothetical protein
LRGRRELACLKDKREEIWQWALWCDDQQVTSLVVIIEDCSAVDRATNFDVVVWELLLCSHLGGCDVDRLVCRSDDM